MKTKTENTGTFSLLKVAELINHSREYCRKRFRAAGIEPTTGRRYSMREITEAFGDKTVVVRSEDKSVAELWRGLLQQIATTALCDGWNGMGESAIETAVGAGLSKEAATLLMARVYALLAMRLAVFLARDAEPIWLEDCAPAEPVKEVEIPFPKWIQEVAQSRGWPMTTDGSAIIATEGLEE